jgi:hypothetical protein
MINQGKRLNLDITCSGCVIHPKAINNGNHRFWEEVDDTRVVNSSDILEVRAKRRTYEKVVSRWRDWKGQILQDIYH